MESCSIRAFPAKFPAALLAIAGFSLVVGAVHAAPTVTAAVEANPATEIKAARPDFRYGWRISNDTSEPVPGVTVIVRTTLSDPASACANPGRCTLGWRLDGRPLPPNSPQPVSLAAAETHELTYEGRADALGLYQSRAIISLVATPIDIRMRRVLAELGTGAIVVGPVGTQILPFFGGARTAPVTIANQSSEALTLTRLPRARLLRDDGSSTYGNFVRDDEISCPSTGSGMTIPPGAQLSCSLAIPWSTGPGRYRVNVSAGGTDVAGASTAADFSLRYHWFYAWLALFVGGLGGAWLEAYQNSGRRRALQLADAQDLSDTAKKARDEADAVAQGDTKAVLQKIVDDLDAKILQLRTNRTADFSQEIAAVAARLPTIGAFAGLEKHYHVLGRPTGAKPAYDAALAAISADTLPADAAQKLADLKAALEAARGPGERQARTGAATDDVGAGGLFAIILPPGSAASLRNWVQRNDRLIAFATILLASTIGVLTLWKTNTTWGSIGDILLALLTGAAGTITGTLTIKGLVSGYPLPTLPAPR